MFLKLHGDRIQLERPLDNRFQDSAWGRSDIRVYDVTDGHRARAESLPE
jgi:hypothetical protein